MQLGGVWNERWSIGHDVSIPQAVSTVATVWWLTPVQPDHYVLVSIPQAVSTVATDPNWKSSENDYYDSFNTASGKYCCNLKEDQQIGISFVKFQYRKR